MIIKTVTGTTDVDVASQADLDALAVRVAALEGHTHDPTDPTDPEDPVDPTDPTDPTNPTDPVDPEDPEDPPVVVPPGDNIMVGHNKIPNFAGNPTHTITSDTLWSEISDLTPSSVVYIKAGATVLFDGAASQVKAIGVEGTLRFSPSAISRLTVQELLVYQSGYLEIGTKQTPITGLVEIVIGDNPLDLMSDPEQWGNGIIVAGKVRMYGSELRDTFLSLAVSPQPGDTRLTLTDVPTDWRVGDTVVLPKTMVLSDVPLTEKFTITAINGVFVTLNDAVMYPHPPATNGDLSTVAKNYQGQELRGYVANLSRSIVIRSEDANDPGHAVCIGRANVDIRYAAFVDLGRTSNDPLDNTTFDENGNVLNVGSNQVGRYALHMHHVNGPVNGIGSDPLDPTDMDRRQFRLIGNSVIAGRKWGISVHASHYGLIQDNVVFASTGAGIITEDGSESYNLFKNNFSFGITGSGLDSRYDEEGKRGAGYWLRGNHNSFVGNVSAATVEGFGFYIQNTSGNGQSAKIEVHIPLFPGADTHKEGEYEIYQISQLPLPKFEGNENYSSSRFGVGLWHIRDLQPKDEPVFKNTTIWNSVGSAVFLDYSVGLFDGLKVIGHESEPTIKAIRTHNANGASGPLVVRNFDFQQVIYGYGEDARTIKEVHFENGHACNYNGFEVSTAQQGTYPRRYVFRNVRFSPVAGHPLQTVLLTFDDRWERGGNYLSYVQHDIQVLFYDYQGEVGNNFRLYFPEQSPDFVIHGKHIPRPANVTARWVIGGREQTVRHFYTEVIGAEPSITMREAWDKHRSVFMRKVAFGAEVNSELGGLVERVGEEYPVLIENPPIPMFIVDNGVVRHNDPIAEGAASIEFDFGGHVVIRSSESDFALPALPSGTHTINASYIGTNGSKWGVTTSADITI